MLRLFLVSTIAVTLSLSGGAASFAITKTSDTVVDPRALTIVGNFGICINGKSFQQNPLVTHGDYQYIAYYDANRWVCVGRRPLPGGDWEVLRLTDYPFKSNDAHNIISLGICGQDGTIHLSFDHHGHPLHYRVSRKGAASNPEDVAWTPELFGPVRSALEDGKPIRITYPRFWPTPDGGLQFCYRRGGSGNGDRMLVDYDAEAGQWKNMRQIDSGKGTWNGSDSRCSYPNDYGYGPDGRLHATWVWREGPHTANHDLVYVYSEDRGVTWKNNAGDVLGEPPSVDSPGVTAVPISDQLCLMNTHGQAVDAKGRVHVVLWHCTVESLAAAGSKPGEHRFGPPEARRNHHYWRDLDGTWHHRELPGVAGNRPKIITDTRGNAYVVYGDDAGLHIVAATAESQWNDWKQVHLEPGPFINEMLPDPARWTGDGILSIMVQEPPEEPHGPSGLRVLEFSVEAR